MTDDNTALNDSSPLLQLPRELRDEIWELAFNSTRLTFGLRYTPRYGERYLKPAPHSLALLRVSRQIHIETRDIWLQAVRITGFYCIQDPPPSVDRLPNDALSQRFRRPHVPS